MNNQINGILYYLSNETNTRFVAVTVFGVISRNIQIKKVKLLKKTVSLFKFVIICNFSYQLQRVF